MSEPTLGQEERDWVALLARAEEELSSEDLDGEIHDLHSKDASAINNSGVAAQIEYIVRNYGGAYATQVLNDLLKPSGETARKDHE